MQRTETGPKVTVIMPAYNAQDYIERSVRSVLNQSFRELELIVVDDGSKDGTAAVLARLASEDGRLRPMTVENGGPATARNRGMAAMAEETEYVMFIDSDDELLPDAVEYAMGAAESGAELIVFGFSIVDKNGGVRDYTEPEQLIQRAELGESLHRLYKANLLNQVWGKLYSAALLRDKGIEFRDYRWGEDRLFIFDCLESARNIYVLPDCKYRYIMHDEESLITKYYDRKFQVCLEADQRMERLCAQLGVTEDGDFRYMFVKSIFSCLTNLFSTSCRLDRAEKRTAAAEILGNERVQRRSVGASGGFPTAVLCGVLHTRSVGLTLFVFRLVALTGELAPGLFIKLKHRK